MLHVNHQAIKQVVLSIFYTQGKLRSFPKFDVRNYSDIFLSLRIVSLFPIQTKEINGRKTENHWSREVKSSII